MNHSSATGLQSNPSARANLDSSVTESATASTAHDLEICGVSKQFGSLKVLENIDLRVKAGEFIAIMGPSGCGKTTLLRIIAGLEGMTSGEIRLQEKDITALSVHRRNTPMVWQCFALFPHLNVQQNIAFGLTLMTHRKAEVKRKVREIAAMMHLEPLLDRRISQLSGGQKQRVAIARALITEPKILLLDEPMSALDPHLRVRMQGELKRLQQSLGISFIYVTHNQNEAFSMADRVVVMNGGRIEQVGTPAEIYSRPATHFVAEFVGNNNLFDGEVISVSPDRVTVRCPQGTMQALWREQPHQVGEASPFPLQGKRVTIVVPAERVALASTEGSVENRLENKIDATLRGFEFMGSQVIYFLETDTGYEVRMIRQEALDHTLAVPINSRLQLVWKTQDTVLLGERIQ
ncbi:ABC transporter ATP-binding protein [Leptolyngbya sp. GB1-A1]|uniref:ABC transporter ATP-binding protein n=1 Tax=Leptolyngbya sp. GB1-A1 TaxID=2933908 RepID=UPI003297B2E0